MGTELLQKDEEAQIKIWSKYLKISIILLLLLIKLIFYGLCLIFLVRCWAFLTLAVTSVWQAVLGYGQ